MTGAKMQEERYREKVCVSVLCVKRKKLATRRDQKNKKTKKKRAQLQGALEEENARVADLTAHLLVGHVAGDDRPEDVLALLQPAPRDAVDLDVVQHIHAVAQRHVRLHAVDYLITKRADDLCA